MADRKKRSKRSKRKTSVRKNERDRYSHLKFSEEEMSVALESGFGIVTGAAIQLRCQRKTVYEYLDRYPDLRLIADSAQKNMVDLGELGLRKKLIKEDWRAIRFTLLTLGKKRGYVERQEITGADGSGLLEQRDLLSAHDKMEKLIASTAKRLADAAKGKTA